MGFFIDAKQDAMTRRGYNLVTREKQIVIARTPYLQLYMPIQWSAAYTWGKDLSPIPLVNEKTLGIREYKKLLSPLLTTLYNGKTIATYGSFSFVDIHKTYQKFTFLTPIGYVSACLLLDQAMKIPRIGTFRISGVISGIYDNTNPENLYTFSVNNFSWSEK